MRQGEELIAIHSKMFQVPPQSDSLFSAVRGFLLKVSTPVPELCCSIVFGNYWSYFVDIVTVLETVCIQTYSCPEVSYAISICVDRSLPCV